MDILVFVIFSLTVNYCFIDGCRSKETSVKISVSNDAGQSKFSKKQDRDLKDLSSDSNENAPSNANTAYMIYPYSYPIPSIQYPAPNSENVGYFQQSDFLQSQFIPSVPPSQIQSVPPQVVANQPTLSSVVPVPMVIQSDVNQPSFSLIPQNDQHHFQTIVRNPNQVAQIDKQQNIQPNVPGVQSDQQNYQQGYGRPPYNPCQNRYCRPDSKCVVRRNHNCPRCPLITVCVNPCDTVRCAEGHVCKAEVGACGTPFCEPRAICKDLCQGVICSGNDTCTLISLPSPTNYNLVPICGRDPCETTVCPLGQGCYLQEQFCSKPPCVVEPVCRDPCKGVICDSGEFCYTEDVTCIKAPCNPITVCKNPCASVLCPTGQQCVLEQAFCIRTPCNPIAVCKPY